MKSALLGLFRPEDLINNPENKNDVLTRHRHVMLKVDKLKNPNMIVSGTRIAFKHLPKLNFSETDLRNFVMQYSKKEGDNKPQKIKLISQV